MRINPGYTYFAENNGRIDCEHAIKLDQRLILGLFSVTVEKELFDALDSEFVMFQLNVVCAGCELLGKVEDIGWECCREKADLDFARQQPFQLV
jgi:hypothetical protein